MSDVEHRLEQARRLRGEERWDEACDAFVEVDEVEPWAPTTSSALAECAQILGRGEFAIATLRRAFEARLESGDVDRALAVGFWLWQALVINGEFSRASGWATLMRGLVDAAARAPRCGAGGCRRAPSEDAGWLLITEAYGLIGPADTRRRVECCRSRLASVLAVPRPTSRRSRRRCGGERSSRRDASTRDSRTSMKRCWPSPTETRRRARRACSTAAPSPPASRPTSGAAPASGPAHSAPGSTNSRSRAACTSAIAGSTGLTSGASAVIGRRPCTN